MYQNYPQPVNVFRQDNRVLEIYQDPNPINPRENRDNLSIITSFGKYKSFIADNNDLGVSISKTWEEFEQYMKEEFDAIIVIPLRVWQGQEYNKYSFDPKPETCHYDRWFSPGIMYTTAARVHQLCGDDPKYYTKEFLREAFESELYEFNLYSAGEVYGYITYTVRICPCCGQEVRENKETCWGFYGDYKKSGLFESAGFNIPDDGIIR